MANKPSSDVKSGTSRDTYVKTLGDYPSIKKVDEIDKVNSPKGRGKAPGSVRV